MACARRSRGGSRRGPSAWSGTPASRSLLHAATSLGMDLADHARRDSQPSRSPRCSRSQNPGTSSERLSSVRLWRRRVPARRHRPPTTAAARRGGRVRHPMPPAARRPPPSLRGSAHQEPVVVRVQIEHLGHRVGRPRREQRGDRGFVREDGRGALEVGVPGGRRCPQDHRERPQVHHPRRPVGADGRRASSGRPSSSTRVRTSRAASMGREVTRSMRRGRDRATRSTSRAGLPVGANRGAVRGTSNGCRRQPPPPWAPSRPRRGWGVARHRTPGGRDATGRWGGPRPGRDLDRPLHRRLIADGYVPVGSVGPEGGSSGEDPLAVRRRDEDRDPAPLFALVSHRGSLTHADGQPAARGARQERYAGGQSSSDARWPSNACSTPSSNSRYASSTSKNQSPAAAARTAGVGDLARPAADLELVAGRRDPGARGARTGRPRASRGPWRSR